MSLGCSKINIPVTVKHVEHTGIIKASRLPGETCKFFSAWGTEKLAGLWSARGISSQADTKNLIPKKRTL